MFPSDANHSCATAHPPPGAVDNHSPASDHLHLHFVPLALPAELDDDGLRLLGIDVGPLGGVGRRQIRAASGVKSMASLMAVRSPSLLIRLR